ncbi:hypothetical protein Y88_3686 [Novosphingobium nitrogenifigens DSM 19370]|uniref:2'-5' RNA ligase n=1 Tax=Novosphingobium nitrogenifigens DSM 19370 TaxID=983920 RepID=F1ZDN9_9SPHN|nr:2'-5' RNA ligase family protein [Novosphingobium nitrogenifigens]EGD57377.1 hypothetical protein Y88_3686 [Novosphingobium nitrogenifigens DSM 19370]
MTTARAPFLVLATLPAPLQARLDALRRAHYPVEHNRSPAHLTLFHAVPGMVAAELADLLAMLTGSMPPPRARFGGVVDLGSGTGVGVASPELADLRETIAERFHGLLSGGDAVPPRFHVTVQNKVERPRARALQRDLPVLWQPCDAQIPGIAIHRVVDGQWQPAGSWRFRGR